jgi:uncharacterized protein YegL
MIEQTPYSADAFNDIELANNPEQRCPCVLVLDCSSSMSGRQIDSLNAAVQRFSDELRADDLAAKRVEIAVVSFGEEVTVLSDFTGAQSFHPTALVADGGTPMGQALCEAVRLIEVRKRKLQEHGINYYRPWLVMMTDGSPTDRDSQHWRNAVSLISSGVDAKKFTYFPLVTEDGDKRTVGELSPQTKVRGLDSHKFSEFFLWLTRSLQSVARSQIGGQATLPAPNDWLTIDV